MLRHAAVPELFWREALEHVTILHNRTATLLLHMKSSAETLMCKVPSNSTLQTFGCTAYVHLNREQRQDRLVRRSEKVYIRTRTMDFIVFIFRERSSFDDWTCVYQRGALPIRSKQRRRQRFSLGSVLAANIHVWGRAGRWNGAIRVGYRSATVSPLTARYGEWRKTNMTTEDDESGDTDKDTGD